MYIDERADDDQMQAVLTILGGKVGGFPALWASMFPEGRKVLGVERAKISYEIAPDQSHWGVEIAGKVKAWAKALVGPTSNPGEYPRMMNAPGSETVQGLSWRRGANPLCARLTPSASASSGRSTRPSTFRSTGMGLELPWARARLSLRSSQFWANPYCIDPTPDLRRYSRR